MDKYKKAEVLEIIRPELEALEQKRQKALATRTRKRILVVGAVVAGGVLVYYCSVVLNSWENLNPLVMFGTWIFVNFLIGLFSSKELKLEQSVGRIILKAIDKNWSYKVNKSLSKGAINQAGMAPWSKAFRGKNLIDGMHGDTHFSFSFFGRKRDKSEVEYDRLFLKADFHKSIKGRTIVFPDFAQKNLGTWLGKKVQEVGWQGLELVYLEDPEFEKQFAVYSTDQVEARYILTPAMMERLLKLSRKYNNRISFSFSDKNVSVLIEGIYPFENDLSTPINPEGVLYDFYRPIEIVTEIIDTLNLNTRIWAKE